MDALELPDPGNGRYWDISTDQSNNYLVTMRTSSGVMVVERTVFAYGATAQTIVQAAIELMINAANITSFVGTYKFEEPVV